MTDLPAWMRFDVEPDDDGDEPLGARPSPSRSAPQPALEVRAANRGRAPGTSRADQPLEPRPVLS
jgi:hypothetical protein